MNMSIKKKTIRKKARKRQRKSVVVTGILSLYGPSSFGMGHVTRIEDIIISPIRYHASLNGGLAILDKAVEDLYRKVGTKGLGRKVKIRFEVV